MSPIWTGQDGDVGDKHIRWHEEGVWTFSSCVRTQESLDQTSVPGDAPSEPRGRSLARRDSHAVDGGNHFRGLALSSVWITGRAYLPICHLQDEVDNTVTSCVSRCVCKHDYRKGLWLWDDESRCNKKQTNQNPPYTPFLCKTREFRYTELDWSMGVHHKRLIRCN